MILATIHSAETASISKGNRSQTAQTVPARFRGEGFTAEAGYWFMYYSLCEASDWCF